MNVLFENWSSVGKAKKVIENSEGTADAKYAQYADSIEAATAEFKASMQGLTSKSTTLSGLLKGIIHLGTRLIKSIDIIGIALAGFSLFKYGPSMINGLIGPEGIGQSMNRTMTGIGYKLRHPTMIWGGKGTFARSQSVADAIYERQMQTFEDAWTSKAATKGIKTKYTVGDLSNTKDFLMKGMGEDLGAFAKMSATEQADWFKNFNGITKGLNI